jgi:alpha-galactosidase
MAGTFGYELDPTKLPPEALEDMREANAEFRRHQHLIVTGDFYRLASPFEGSITAWEFAAPDQSEAFVQCFTVIQDCNAWDFRVYPQGLAPDALYAIEDWSLTLRGDTIMHAGLRLQHFGGDFESRNIYLQRV